MNIKFTLEYDGTNYHGWQIQKELPTIQGELKKAFELVLPNEKINIIGSGRTDQGVHANGQVASLHISNNIDLPKLFKSINGIINDDIYIKNFEIMDENFNARFSAQHRLYKYYLTKEYSPFKKNIAWFLKSNIDVKLLEACASVLIGEHDFSMLSKNNIEVQNKNCIIYESVWEDSKNELIYTIKANRFLHHMVRFIVGASIEAAKSKIQLDDFIDLVNNKSNIHPFCAPAKGLFLHEVSYG